MPPRKKALPSKALDKLANNNSDRDVFSTLPPELMSLILDNLDDPKSLSGLCRTSKAFHQMTMPRLYSKIDVSALYHSKIPKLIRTLEPLLSVAQKKQLKKEGKYKGQQERYDAHVEDETIVPHCARFVRQLIIGRSDPGRKHQFIVDRYIEEVLKNLPELRVVETWMLNSAIAESLTSLKYLRALNVHEPHFPSQERNPVKNIKNLEHLAVSRGSYYESGEPWQTVIRNSAATLQTLYFECFDIAGNVFVKDRSDPPVAALPRLTALERLSLVCVASTNEGLAAMEQAIDFTNLRELKLDELGDALTLFAFRLSNLFEDATSAGRPIRISRLEIKIDGHHQTIDWTRLIGSFESLRELHISNYGHYNSDLNSNLDLSEGLLQAVLKHKKITQLHFQTVSMIRNDCVSSFSPAKVQALIAGLPFLRDFYSPVKVEETEAFAKILTSAKSLAELTFEPIQNGQPWSVDVKEQNTLIQDILKVFLMEAFAHTPAENDFCWDDHFALRNIGTSHVKWQVASTFGKRKKGIKITEEVVHVSTSGVTRSVTARDITNQFPILFNQGYDPNSDFLHFAKQSLS